jgi:purine-binding chemotaxis protein CheW
MDFLEIRRKAKERAAAEAGQSPAAPDPAPSAAAPPAAASPAAASPAAAPPTAAPPSAAPPAPPRAPEPPDAGPVLREADVAQGQLAAGLQGLPPAIVEPPGDDSREDAEPGGPIDERFTTWRPGSGERPIVDLDLPEPGLEPRSAPQEATIVDRPVVEPARAPRPPEPPEPRPVAAPPLPPPSAWEPSPEPAPRRATSYSPVPARDPLDEFFYRVDEELSTAASLPAGEERESEEIEDAGVEEYLTFLLGAEEFAVAIERVREVLKSQAITEVPRAPAGILGVVTVRGDVVAVFDPRRRLGLPGPTPEAGLGRIIIVDDGEGPCGLLVDTVANVVRLARGSIEPTPQGIGGAAADCLAGIGREEGRLFTVLDLAAVLRRGAGAPRGGRGAHDGA